MVVILAPIVSMVVGIPGKTGHDGFVKAPHFRCLSADTFGPKEGGRFCEPFLTRRMSSYLGSHMDKTVQAVVLTAGGLAASATILKYLDSRMPKGCATVWGNGMLGMLLGCLPDVWDAIMKFEAHSHLV